MCRSIDDYNGVVVIVSSRIPGLWGEIRDRGGRKPAQAKHFLTSNWLCTNCGKVKIFKLSVENFVSCSRSVMNRIWRQPLKRRRQPLLMVRPTVSILRRQSSVCRVRSTPWAPSGGEECYTDIRGRRVDVIRGKQTLLMHASDNVLLNGEHRDASLTLIQMKLIEYGVQV